MAQDQEIKLFAQPQDQKLNFAGAAKEMTTKHAVNTTVDLVSEKAKDDSGEKVGRNDLCPCGSGKKYKKCHGK